MSGAVGTPAVPAATVIPDAAATAATPAAPAAGAPAATDAAQAPAATATEATDLSTLTPAELAAEVAKWKALSRKNEDQAKANIEKAKQFDALEDAKKTAEQKLQEENERLKAELATEKGGSMKAQVAAAKGVPIGLLHGETREALEAAADEALAFKGVPAVPAQDAAASVAGGTPVGEPAQLTSVAGMSREDIRVALKEGRLKTLMGQG
jgi:hypothetical protein